MELIAFDKGSVFTMLQEILTKRVAHNKINKCDLQPQPARGKHQQIPVHDGGGRGSNFVLMNFFPGLVTCDIVEKSDFNI